MSGLRIAAIRLLCTDPERTARFYRAAFEAAIHLEGETTMVAIGDQWVELARTSLGEAPPQPSNATSSQHFAIVVSDLGAAWERLRSVANWTPISRAGPERLPASSGGVTAFKFRDPDGHPLELLCFPENTKPAAWRGRSGLFLGIDHTAITVADTERSIAFYAALGFAVTSRGVNRGPEQERLDDVSSPVVEVTALAPPGGQPPHLELLCYREPGSLLVSLTATSVLATRILMTNEFRQFCRDASDLSDPDDHRLGIAAR